LAVLVLLMGAGTVQADTILYSCDFESPVTLGNLTTSTIAGQDGWVLTSGYNNAVVASGFGVDTTQVVTTGASLLAYGAQKSLSLAPFTSSSPAVTMSGWFRNTGGGTISLAGLQWGATATEIGIMSGGSSPGKVTYGWGGYYGPDLTLGNWYEIKAVMTFATAGGLVDLSYRDATAGATAFTSVATGIAAGIPLVSGQYQATGFSLRMFNNSNGTAYQDNFSVSQIPEPSTLALLAAGLVGLLCYAWRKRR